MEEENLTLRPTVRYWLCRWTPLWLLTWAGEYLTVTLIPKTVTGAEPVDARIWVVIALVLAAVCALDAFRVLALTQWTVTREQILIHEGLLHRETNYTELYRVTDFRLTQSFTEMILGIYTLTVYSSDKSNPKLRIFGIANAKPVVETIRRRVEAQRQEKHITEFTNYEN